MASTSQAYTVELRFGELWWSNPGQRVFDVTLEGQTILNDLDILAQTGSFNTPYTYVSGPITAGANGTLDLQFANGIDSAKLSGIVVRQVSGGGGTDMTKPTVGPFTVQAPVAGDASASVTVVYNDASGINLASITAADIAVTGPGATGAITLQSKTSTSATSATATYIVAAPTGGWTNGQYTATVKTGEVSDASPAANTNLAASQLFSVQTSSAGGIVAAINAGGAALIQDGISFSADQYFTGGATFIDSTGGNGLQSVFTNTVYQTERYGNFSYAIPVASTSQAYTVELRFGELWWSNPGQRVFDVSLEGQIVVNDLDILAQTGSFNTPYTYVSGPITAGANGTLDLQFANGIDNAKLSGIVVRKANTQTGGPGSDYLIGDAGVDVLSGGAGDDALIGQAGNDFLYGDDGNDTLIGGLDADQMSGGLGNDVYEIDNIADFAIEIPDAGFDAVYSSTSYALSSNVEALIFVGSDNLNGTGNDSGNVLIGNAGQNVLIGGGGDDVYGVDGNGDTVIEQPGGGYDEVYSSGNFVLPDNIETLFLTGSAIYGAGNSSNNALIGNNLDNVLDAGQGTFESLVGGAGNDTLIGGAGHDQLLGGTGADIFRFQNPTTDVFNGANNDGDFIFDFTASQGDKLQLNASAFGLSFGVVEGVNFFAGTSPAATQATPTLLYNTQSSLLFYDADGSGAGGLTIMAGLGGSPTLHASDFILY
ncbi:hypothetical protein LFADAHJC_LOCUS3144 [Methylorubrum extorquens]